mmetsp:Transcript_63648/g.148412  ORF Transcript_63648/g.148412 Transcript_63648/m.148412 type:complete len:940 (+) Transcript_63648:53-2872(+)
MTRHKQAKRVPYLSLFFIAAALICHTLVLAGNLHTVNSLHKLGASSGGWAATGMNLADSMGDFGASMFAVAKTLALSIETVLVIERTVDILLLNVSESLALVANKTPVRDAMVSYSPDTDSFIQLELSIADTVDEQPRKNTASFCGGRCQGVQMSHPWVFDASLSRRGPCDEVVNASERLIKDIAPKLNQLIDTLKPAFERIGRWLQDLGEKVKSYVGHMATTMAKVQEIFEIVTDSVVSSLTSHEEMIEQTYNLFDTSNTGLISLSDLRNVSDIFGVAVLQGERAAAIFERFDENGDQMLDKEEFGRMVLDPSTPGIMELVLRTFANRLAAVAGPLKRAESRADVAGAVASYLQTVVSKNMTKVGWIAQALTNGSLPTNFTMSLMNQLAMAVEDPSKITTVETGGVLVKRMVDFNPKVVKEVLESLVDSEVWVSEGLDPELQPTVVERVAKWAVAAGISLGESVCSTLVGEAHLHVNSHDQAELIDSTQRKRQLEHEMLMLPKLYRWRAERGSRLRMVAARAARARQMQAVLVSSTSRAVHEELLRSMGRTLSLEENSEAERVINGRRAASPEALRFAQWLANNATRTSNTLRSACFDYSQKMSETVQGLGNQIRGILDRISLALHYLATYSSSSAMNSLDAIVDSFIRNATAELYDTCNKLVTSPRLARGVLVPVNGVWAKTLRILREIGDAVPGVIESMEAARAATNSFSSSLSSVFDTLHEKAPVGFHKGAGVWKTIWVVYYLVFLCVNLFMFLWIMWFSGFLGGEPIPEEEYEPPMTMRERLRVCCLSCNACLRANLSNNHAIFWSILLAVQILVIVAFLVALLLCVLAVIKLFVFSGCAQFYMLGDVTVCSEVMKNIKYWLDTFLSQDFISPWTVCHERQLLTCNLISRDLLTSSVLTVVGGLLASFFDFQVIVETAILHERALWSHSLQKEL